MGTVDLTTYFSQYWWFFRQWHNRDGTRSCYW